VELGMKESDRDFFAHKAENYEKEQKRVDNVANIANLILKEIEYTQDMNIMDFGSGTGLLLSKIAPHVKSITAIDMSESMNRVLSEKRETIDCIVHIKQIDLSKETPDMKFDNIISSMTIHHIQDTEKLFAKFYTMLHDGGTIALSDLDTEDGTFHKEDTGVYHFGFDRDKFLQSAKKAGFKNLKIQTVGDVIKPYGAYGVFLLTGERQEQL
jgi:cyclopropane fatty-acyl-phospholipid synthase-like methyltransferase